MFEVTEQARALKNAAHIAAAQAHEDFHRQDGRSQMGQHAVRPISDEQAAKLDAELERDEQADDEQAVKASQRHPLTGQYVSDQTAYGATHGPLAEALALHRPASPLASLVTAPGPAGGALASSIAANPGAVNLAQLDYRNGVAPGTVNPSPVRPDFHTAPNGVRS